jgi:hypothetical protein
MASRRAEREARGELEPRRRLVSIGWHRETVDGLGSNDKPSAREYELLYDPARPADVFVHLSRDGALMPIVGRRYDSDGHNRVLTPA